MHLYVRVYADIIGRYCIVWCDMYDMYRSITRKYKNYMGFYFNNLMSYF